MKKNNKNFDLLVWDNNSNSKIVKIAGRDIWDAYKKAQNKYEAVREPYTWSSKYDRKRFIRNSRRKKNMDRRSEKSADKTAWVSYSKGVMTFD
jgi:hypothetical protein